MDKEKLRLYAVTDRSYLHGLSLEEAVREAILGGAAAVQLREKDMDDDGLRKEAAAIQAVCRKYGALFILDDNVALVKELDLDGVHVGQNDMPASMAREILGPGKIIGVTAKTTEQAKKAYADGADYLGSGAMFTTSTKPDALPMTPEKLREITQCVPIPVVAIGGISIENITGLKGCGIAGAAVSEGIFAAENIREAAALLRKASEEL